MSQQIICDVDFADEDVLVKVLKDMGYSPVVHKEAVSLRVYGGRKDIKAHIVISKENGRFTYADLGFERTKNGLKLHADHSDINKLGLTALTQKYTKSFLAKRMKLLGTQFFLGNEEIDEEGTMIIKINATEYNDD